MKIYKIENGKTVEEIEVTNFTKKNGEYCFFVKGCSFEYCGLFWINLCNSRDNVFYSLKRH